MPKISMKLLTLNCSAYRSDDSEKALANLIQTIAQGDYDVIALQEVNQEMDKPALELSELDNYIPCQDRIPLKEGNYAYEIVKALKNSGQNWLFTWLPVHIGWEKFDEGLAILTPHSIRKTNSFFVSNQKDYSNVKTRMALGVELEFTGKKEWFYSVHFNKWTTVNEPFDKQWDKFWGIASKTAEPIFVMGDFNNDSSTKGEAYDYILNNSNLIDTFKAAEFKDNGITVNDYIAGWVEKDHPKQIRIDFIFTNTDLPVLSSQVIFNGINQPKVSDHFGVEVELGEKQKVFKKNNTVIPEFITQTVISMPLSTYRYSGALIIQNSKQNKNDKE